MSELQRTPRAPRRRRGCAAFVAVLLVVLTAYLVVQKTVFVLRTVTVEGARVYTPEEVVSIAGLRNGQSILTIRDEDVAARISQDMLLIFDSMYRDYPSHVILRVHERTPRALLTWLGVRVELDENGRVMRTTNRIDEWLQVPMVKGIEVTDMRVGERLASRDPRQVEAMKQVLDELVMQGVLAEMAELNVASVNDLYLTTWGGMRVDLGDAKELELKIGIARAALAELAAQGTLTGTLDVSTAQYADYREVKTFAMEYKPESTLIPLPTATPRP